MLQVQSIEQSTLSQSQVYEDLSEIIKSFKLLLNAVENIANKTYKLQTAEDLVEDLRDKLRSLDGFVKHYSYSVNSQSIHRNTFHRFVCRLIQTISGYKLKFQSLQYYHLLSQEIKQVESIVISYQNQKNIGIIIRRIQCVLYRYCSKRTTNKSGFSIRKPYNQLDQISRLKYKNFASISHQYEDNQDKSNVFTLTINEIRPKNVLQSNSQNSLNKIMNFLQKKYRVLSCLDIEYQQFKQLFFRSRDSKDQLYDDCFARNSFIYKEIIKYSKQFNEYLQKRQMKIFRKNKFVETFTPNNNAKVKLKNNPPKVEELKQINYNFTRRKIQGESRKTFYNNNLIQSKESNTQAYKSNIQSYSQQNSPFLMTKSNLIDQKNQNYLSNDQTDMSRMTPQANQNKKKAFIFPLMMTAQVHIKQRQNKQEIMEQSFLEMTKRKKNLQLKKIDISLSNFNETSGQIQSAKFKNKLMSNDLLKKSSVQISKQIDQKINASIRNNFLQKRYQNAMKKNIPYKINNFESESFQQLISEESQSNKCIEIEQKISPSPQRLTNQRRYLIKTSNKRSTNPGNQIRSENVTSKKSQGLNRRNFKSVKMEQMDKIQKLERMRQKNISYFEISSGGKSIKPILPTSYLQKQYYKIHTEGCDQQFADARL